MNIAIISASTRLGRQTHKAALGLQKHLQQFQHLQPVLVDLLEYKIPLFEETLTRHPDPSDTLRELGAILGRADAMLFVTPEYNGSYSPALKNAVDHYNKPEFRPQSHWHRNRYDRGDGGRAGGPGPATPHPGLVCLPHAPDAARAVRADQV
jgi:NAD(P)H-dependent FMN reductase